MSSNLVLHKDAVPVPLTVPTSMREAFINNYLKATCNTGRLLLFAGDQKVEHLNKDFFGPDISPESANPTHLFDIASKSRIGAFATNLGLVARYASDYKNVRYVIKLNGKTNLVPTQQADPNSCMWTPVQQVVEFKKQTGLDIVGIGMTVYLGSEHESAMLAQAAQAIYQAHQNGLMTTVWMYPRGKAVQNERSADIIAGVAGIAVCLGADFVKVNAPEAADSFESAQLLRQATMAAGNTRVICAGGQSKSEKEFLQALYHQIHGGGAMGAAVGRNIHQKSTQEAIKFCNALAAIIIDDADVATAEQCLK